MKKTVFLVFLLVAITGALICQESQVAEPKVLISGEVVEPTGKAVKGFSVSLIVEREVLDISTLKSSTKNRKVFTTETDADGKYFFTWKLDDYYNRFYINYITEGRFDDVQFLPPSEPLIDISKYIGKGKNFEHKLILFYHPSWDKIRKLIEVYGSESDKGKILRTHGFFEKETEEEIAGEKYSFWWYYAKGKAFKFSGEKLIKEYKFQPLESLEKKD
jgi:hypothetical protein